MAVVLLIMTVIMAAMAPVMTTRLSANKVAQGGGGAGGTSIWKYVEDSGDTDIYYGTKDNQRAMIGQNKAETAENARLILNTSDDIPNHLILKTPKNSLAKLTLDNNDNLILGIDNKLSKTEGGYNSPKSSIIIGKNSELLSSMGGHRGILIGENTYASSHTGGTIAGQIAIGTNARATQSGNYKVVDTVFGDIAIGSGASTIGAGNIAIGAGANVNKYKDGFKDAPDHTIAIGYSAFSGNDEQVVIGSRAEAGNIRSIVIGNDASAESSDYLNPLIAIGYKAKVTGRYGMAIGSEAEALGYGSLAIGMNFGSIGSVASGDYSIAIRGQATEGNSIAFCGNSYASSGVAINGTVYGTGSNSVAISGGTEGAYSIAIQGSTTGEAAIALGQKASAKGNQSVAIGYNAFSSYEKSIAIGYGSRAVNKNSTAIGYNAKTTTDNTIVLGTASETVQIPGSLTVATTNYPSDKKLKNIDKEYTSGLDKIKNLKPYNFTYKDDKTKTPRVGVIAQDLKKVFPDAVSKGKDGFLTIRLEDMFYALINAVKELDAKVTQLIKQESDKDKKIKELEKRIELLEQKLK